VLVYGKPWARKAASVYVEAIRNAPLIVSCSSSSSDCPAWTEAR
jgi:hypothetical protein